MNKTKSNITVRYSIRDQTWDKFTKAAPTSSHEWNNKWLNVRIQVWHNIWRQTGDHIENQLEEEARDVFRDG